MAKKPKAKKEKFVAFAQSDVVRAYAERQMRLEDEFAALRADFAEDMKELRAQGKAAGVDMAALKRVIAERRAMEALTEKNPALAGRIEDYRDILGALEGTPLGDYAAQGIRGEGKTAAQGIRGAEIPTETVAGVIKARRDAAIAHIKGDGTAPPKKPRKSKRKVIEALEEAGV